MARHTRARLLKGLVGSALLASLVGMLSACAQNKEEILDGERLPVRAAFDDSINTDTSASTFAGGVLILPEAIANTRWTSRGGAADHFTPHVALSPSPQLAWSRPIGQGTNKRLKLSAEPIVTENAIYTLDAKAGLRAFDLGGGLLWQHSLIPPADSNDDISGGGIAFDNGRLVVTTGYGEVIALGASGEILWRHRLGAPASNPVVQGDTAIVIAGGRIAVALGMAQGRELWRQEVARASSGVLGTGSPAIADDFAVLPFATGSVRLALLDSGVLLWTQTLSGVRAGSARGFITAISADPVVRDGVIYAGTQAGTSSALSLKTGERLWVINEGGMSPMVPVGNSVFLLSDEYKLMRRVRATGAPIWEHQLPLYSNVGKKTGNYAHFGPVLAGGRLWVAGSDGSLRGFDPMTGEVLETIGITGGGAGSHPVVAGGVLYMLSKDGQLLAYK